MTQSGPGYDVGHTHPDISGGWLRAATFGAMDGLVSNTGLIAGVAAASSAHIVTVSGVAGLLAGAFSMALGEYTSVTTANEQIESEVRVERKSLRTRPQAERAELIGMLVGIGLTEKTAEAATDEIHRDENRAINVHLVREIGVNPDKKPSAWLAAVASFVMFATGAIIPLMPYLLGYGSLAAGLACGGVGLLIAGGLTARFTRKPVWWAGSRQLLMGAVAVAATYLVGSLVGAAHVTHVRGGVLPRRPQPVPDEPRPQRAEKQKYAHVEHPPARIVGPHQVVGGKRVDPVHIDGRRRRRESPLGRDEPGDLVVAPGAHQWNQPAGEQQRGQDHRQQQRQHLAQRITQRGHRQPDDRRDDGRGGHGHVQLESGIAEQDSAVRRARLLPRRRWRSERPPG